MRENRRAGGALRRRLVAGAALGTAATRAVRGRVTRPAVAAPGGPATGPGTNQPGRTITVTVNPGQALDPKSETRLALSGTNFATKNGWGMAFGGAYLLFGVVNLKDANDPGSWAPSKGGSAPVNYDYAAGAGVYQSMVSYPGNTSEPDAAVMDADGNWATSLTIPGATFTSQSGNPIDCTVQQCGVITIGAHGSQQAGVESFTPVTFAEPVAPAMSTTTTLAQADPATGAVRGRTDVKLSATVTPANASGTVEFLSGETVLGSAPVTDGTATLAKNDLAGGAHKLSARFVPADAAVFAPSVSAAEPARTVRVIDTARAVADIAVGDAAEKISGAELTWSVSNFAGEGTNAHKKSVVSGDVKLTNGATDAARDFVFSGGTGSRDAAGNTVIAFTGAVQLATRAGDAQRIVVTNPVLRTNAAGDGYVTADLSGSAPSGAYTPAKNVTIATFKGGTSSVAAGKTSFTATPLWDGQAAAGTWAGDYTASFPTEFVAQLDSAIRSDFAQTGTGAAQASKAPRAVTATFTAGAVVTAPEPTGISQGKPLNGTSAYITVEPGEQLRVDGATELTLKGFGFDPGPAVAPGTGSGGIYVGFGTMKDPTNPEKWRRSKGGTSGPIGMGDYTYGAPIFVANQNSGSADQADAIMAADGTWTAKLTVPKAQVPSYFGDTVDCSALQCGVFSFGAHGAVKAQNEAFTPVYFAGQTVPEDPAAETTTALSAQPTAAYPTDFAGKNVTVEANVAPATAAGTVEFFAGEMSLGSAEVESGAAKLTTKKFTGGAHKVTAKFTPKDAKKFAASASTAQTFRIVDLTPAVSGISTGAAVSEITDASLTWSIANYLSFGSGPAKSVLSGDVTINADKDFVFTGGHGVSDAAGNRVVSFTGAVRLTSGILPEWNFRDPQVHVNQAGDGYITAVVDGAFFGSEIGDKDESYGPERVTVSTFTQGALEAGDTTQVFRATPLFAGQVAAGTWGGDFTGATFTNEFLRHINAGVRGFFVQSGSSSDATKAGRAISVQFAEQALAPAELKVTPTTGLDREKANISIAASGFDTSGKPSYPGAPDAPAGVYVSLGWISNDGWRPSEGAAGASRVAVATKWVQETEETGGQYLKWTKDRAGRASFEFDFTNVSYADVLAKKPATGDYRLAVFSLGASGVKQAANEFATDIAFAAAKPTVTTVAPQLSGQVTTDFVGKDLTLSATVAPAVAGTVEFVAGGKSLGTAPVENGAAKLTTKKLSAGANQVTAVFTPADAVLYEGSTAAAQTYRVVDLTRNVADISVGATAEKITGATFQWSVANYYSSFGYAFDKTAIGDGVTVAAEVPDDKEAASNRLFTFSGGTGTRDAAGNAVIKFTGTARVASGASSQWNFTDPQLHLNAQGAGYVTAEFSGYFKLDGVGEQEYAKKRVTVATFTGAQLAQQDGAESFTIAPVWEGQVAPGTWAADYTGSFPAEFTSLLNANIRAFFTQTGTTGANLTKPTRPISVAFTAGTAPQVTGQPQGATATAGETASFTVQASGKPAPAVQWQHRASKTAKWADIAGATAAQLQLADVALADSGAQYRAIVTNAFGSAESQAATLQVVPAKPTTDPAAPEITPETKGNVNVLSAQGRTVTVELGAAYANTWIGVTLHSTPRFLGWFLADSAGKITVEVPADVTGDHHLSFVTADGETIGWVPVSYSATGGTEQENPPAGGKTPTKPAASADKVAKTGGATAPLALAGGAALLLAAGAVAFAAARRRTTAE